MNRLHRNAFAIVLAFLGVGCVLNRASAAGEVEKSQVDGEARETSELEPPRIRETRPEKAPSDSRAKPKPHKQIVSYEFGQGQRSYIIFEPSDPKPEHAPVVVFLHGWFAVNPAIYGAWIDHLVRDGKIVIFPRYQNDVRTNPQKFLGNALAAIRDALSVLGAGRGHVRPRLDQLALIGHSAGGNLAAYIAAVASDLNSGIPSPKAVVALMPGEVFPQREPSLAKIPEKTLLVVMVGEEDILVGDVRGREIFSEATAVPKARKRYIMFRSDRHGYPPLLAEHTAPTGANRRLDTGDGVLKSLQLTLGEVNAFDHAGFWRIADMTLDAAFSNKTLDRVITNPEQFRQLGFWSDGRRVTPPIIADNLDDVPRAILYNGVRLIPWRFPIRIGSSADSDESRTR
jgi:acetyl esterase/lipase